MNFVKITDDELVVNEEQYWSLDKISKSFGLRKPTIYQWARRKGARIIRYNKKVYIPIKEFWSKYLGLMI